MHLTPGLLASPLGPAADRLAGAVFAPRLFAPLLPDAADLIGRRAFAPRAGLDLLLGDASMVLSRAVFSPRGNRPDPLLLSASAAQVLRGDGTYGPATAYARTAATDGATVTFDLSASSKYSVVLGGNRILAVSNDVNGQNFDLILQQDGTGSRTVTWWSGILWPGGNAPVLTTGANKRDRFSFERLAAGSYMGMVVPNF